jgi:hypothetical protein
LIPQEPPDFVVRAEKYENDVIIFQAEQRTHPQPESGFPQGVRIQFPESQSRVAGRIGKVRPEIYEDLH